MVKFTLYEGDSITRVQTKIAEGSHAVLGDMMNMKRHIPTPAGKNRIFHQLYSGSRLVSSTY